MSHRSLFTPAILACGLLFGSLAAQAEEAAKVQIDSSASSSDNLAAIHRESGMSHTLHDSGVSVADLKKMRDTLNQNASDLQELRRIVDEQSRQIGELQRRLEDTNRKVQ
ncbi:hypothetical protein ACIP1T_25350 [Pseudomonas japonica]|uniref:hypothetical protein n=1 Tax=Pseudomonas japonica TaxID=256466 RepID=UPI003806977E